MKRTITVWLLLVWASVSVLKGQSMDYPPVANLETSVYDDDVVLLTWNLPSGNEARPMMLSWTKQDSIDDMVQYGFDTYMGSLFDTLDLRPFVGWKIETVSFYKISNWTHTIYIWEQQQGGMANVIYSQEVPEEAPFGMNNVTLNEDVLIEPNADYLISVRITKHVGQQGYTYPFAMVYSGMNGKSNLVRDGVNGSTWMTIPGNLHFWIRTTLIRPIEKPYLDGQSLDGYRVYRNGMLVQEIPYAFMTYYTDTDFSDYSDVEYCVTAIYGESESEALCSTATILSIEDGDLNDSFIISPNPTEGNIKIEGVKVVGFRVYSTSGQLVETFNNTNEIDVSNLSQGIYLLRVVDDQGLVITEKILVR